MPSRRLVLFGVVSGTALWLTLGVLDVYESPSGLTRAALLPSLSRWLMAVTGAATVVLGLSVVSHAHALSPLGLLVILALPYVPWLPDHAPLVTVLAGPVKWIVWAIVLAEVGRRLAHRLLRSSLAAFWTDMRTAVTVSLLLLVALGGAAARLSGTGTGLYPAGDEPHYLVMAQSVWRDNDLRIENNHAQGDYTEYYAAGELAPHYLTRGVDGEIYSIHPVGLPVLLAPVYAAGGYRGVRAALICISSLVAFVLLVWLRRLGVSRGPALFGWSAVATSSPFVFFSFAVYPEMVAGLLVVLSMMLLSLGEQPRPRTVFDHNASVWPWIGIGLSAAALPWLSTKYAPMAAAIVLVATARAWMTGPSTTTARLRRALATITPAAGSLVAWLLFFTLLWGTPSPSAPYGNDADTTIRHLVAGGPGLIADQEYGLLAYAPVFILAFTGFVSMCRAGGPPRRLAVELGVVAGALVATVGAFHIWWGGSAPPGRPIVSILPVLGLPVAWHYGRLRAQPMRAALSRALLVTSASVTLLLATTQRGLLLANTRDGTSAMLEYLSPLWPLTDVLPSFIRDPTLTAWALAGFWGAFAWLGVLLITRSSSGRVARLGGSAPMVAALVILLSLTLPFFTSTDPSRSALIENRSRSTILDRYDRSSLPFAVAFDPARSVLATEIPPRFSFVVRPSQAPPTDSALLYGRRLSLPAGEYAIDVSATRSGTGELGLRIGRAGPVFEQWTVQLGGGKIWSTQVSIAADVGYVGFQAGPRLEALQPTIRMTPTSVRDVSDRPPTIPVAAALRTGSASYFFHTNDVHIQPTGFWTRSGRSASVLIARELEMPPARSVTLRTRCGPVANTVSLSAGEQHQQARLAPGARRDIEFQTRDGALQLNVGAAAGFVPAALGLDPEDKRDLGCWVEVIGWTR